MKSKYHYLIGLSVLLMFSCKTDNPNKEKILSEEYYSGGVLGTVFDETPLAYEQPTPVVEEQGFAVAFKFGEALFEKEFNSNATGVRRGLGPVSVRSSCITCHPGYGHGKRMTRYNSHEYGNGYLLVVTDENDNYVSSLTGMPQTQSVYPFLPPIDESQIQINWLEHTDSYGNRFPDGETYSLIYPEVTIPRGAFNVPMPDYYKVRLEATIGIYGTGLIDAIDDDSIIAQYRREKSLGYFALNDAKYQSENFIVESDGTSHPGRYTYGLTRGTLQNGPGANAIWNITNVTRSNRAYNYITVAYAKEMAGNTFIQSELGKDSATIYAELMSTNLPAEMTDEDYVNFMVWHRGLAVPAARSMDDKAVQKGKENFKQAGCTVCHRPSWTTGADNYSGDNLVKNKLPRYPHQKIYPYTDLLQHKLDMVNGIRTGWCRTTPLWGRGLSEICTGASEHLHDMRARNYVEAIMWHSGDAATARDKFHKMSKEDRDALVKFLQSI
ncbi:MAG: hypothetical protein LBT04_09740 [Prevotellaceae bacterium]|nr:hypothetical protein [Prevotellaceae bacterium]